MLLIVGALAVGVGVVLTRTESGRERVRAAVASRLTGSLQPGATVHIGRIRGGLLGGFAIDSIAVREADGTLVFAAGQTRVTYDPRDILDRRLLIDFLDIGNAYVHLVQREDGSWNFKQVFRSARQQVERRVGRRFGDYVVIDSARLRNATLIVTMPWHPADSLRGARRDSVIREHLARPGNAFQRTRDGHFTHTYRWTQANAWLSHARLADPDSAGRLFVVARLDVQESEPPFTFRNARLTARQLGDSVWFESPGFQTLVSRGRARGKVVWGSGLPVRYDARVWGDSVLLSDVAWVYPTLPTTGGGRLVLDLRNDPRNLRVIDYRLSEMDVRTTGSRLRGAMTFAVGGPVLVVKDVDVRADPVDFDLLRTFAGAPFPVDWQGTLTGTVQGRGGPLTHFVVDRSDITFRDKHVRGAVSRFQGRGGLNVLRPAYTEFQGFRVDVARLDMRTIQHLYPEFPPLGGTVAGVATLDSSWMDVRFRDADVTHRNGPETPSRVTGQGRVTYGDAFLVYDLDVEARPLSLPMIARAYPNLPLTGLVSGPVRVRGTTDSLALSAVLTGDAGRMRFDGVVDVYEPVWRVRGTGTVASFDAPRLFTLDGLPETAIDGAYDLDMQFVWGGPAMDSLVAVGGRATVDLGRSTVAGATIEPSEARLRFADGRVRVDSLRLAMPGAVAVARGGIGLPGGSADSLHLRAIVDSVGRLRAGLGLAGAASALDSVGGRLEIVATATGRLDALDVAGTVQGDSVGAGSVGAERVSGRFDVADVTGARRGAAALRLLGTRIAGVRSDSITGRVAFSSPTAGEVTAQLFGGQGPSAHAHAAYARDGALTRLTLDTLTLHAGDHSVALASPAGIVLDTLGGIALDSLVLRDPHHGEIRLSADLPAAGEISADLFADSVSLADLASILHRENAAHGTAAMLASLRGTRAAPVLHAEVALDEPGWGTMRFGRVTANADYVDGRARGALDVRVAGRSAIAGAVNAPVALTLSSVTTVPGDSVRGWIAADSTDLSLLESLGDIVENARGTLRSRIDLMGTWGNPILDGFLRVDDGAADVVPLGIRLRRVNADVVLVPGADSISVRAVSAESGPAGSMVLRGYATFGDPADPRFDLELRARAFHAIERRDVAQLDVSTGVDGIRLSGRKSAARLAGTLSVDRGTIFIPDTRGKEVVDVTDADLVALFDSTAARTRTGLASVAPSTLVENLRLDGVGVRLGDEVWLRSREAKVKLGGALSVTRAVAQDEPGFGGATADSLTYRLALAGTLSADRGTYTLDLGPVRREFQVERGTVTFFGTADNNPALDIAAQYTVHQYQQEDVRVRVRLTGPLYPQPTLVLENAGGYALSQSDLISYLVTGRPSVELGAFTDRGVQTATSVLLPTVSSAVSSTLRDQFGGWVDQIRFETGTAELASAREALGEQGLDALIYTSRLGGEKQIGENWFVSLSSGLCQLKRDASTQPELEAFVSQLAWRLEYRFPERLTLQAGREPARSAYDCGRGGTIRGVVNTPAQWAFSLARSWRF